MNKFILLLFFAFNVNALAQETSPILSNFRIENNQKSRVYFDSNKAIFGSNWKGFTISGKKITKIKISKGNTSGHYFEVSGSFTFWDNNTVRYDGGANIKDRNNNKLSVFTLSFIKNKLRLKEGTVKEIYVNSKVSRSGNGASEKEAYKTLKEAIKALPEGGGGKIWVKAGHVYKEGALRSIPRNNKSTLPNVIEGYIKKPGDISTMYYDYVANGKLKKLDKNKMPLFDGGRRDNGSIFCDVQNSDYFIVRNIQVTNYQTAFRAGTMTGFVADNVLIKDMGSLDSSDGYGFEMESNISESNLVRIKNSIIINATHTGIKIAGNHGLIENTKVYCNEALGLKDIDAPTDYYYLIAGSDNIIRNSIAFKDTPNGWGHNGHGFSLKTQKNLAPVHYNLIEFCTAINIYGSFQARHMNCKYNVFKDSEAHAKIPNRGRGKSDQKTGGIQFVSGGSHNTFERLYIHDVDVAISWIANGEWDADVNIQQNSIIRNCVFDNINVAIRAYHTTTGGTSRPSGNKVFNCTFNNIDAMYRMVNGRPFKFADNEFKNVIFNAIPLRDSELPFKGGWSYEYSNFHNTWAVEKGKGNVSLAPGFENESKSNFRLKSNSSMIDKGQNLKDVTADFENNTRTLNKSHDIGAYEYQSKKTASIKADAGEDQTICKGEELVLTATGGNKYSWSNGKKTNSITVSPDKTTTYKVTVSAGGKSDDAEVTVTVNEVKAYAGKDVTIKKGEEVTLKASGGDTYLWSNGKKTQSITVSPDRTKTYSVTVSTDGCEDVDKVTVKVESASTPVVAGISEDLTICRGDEIVLKASGGIDYSWSNGETGSEIKVSPDKTTTYEVIVSDGLTSDEAEVTVTVNEVKAYAGKDVTIKKGEDATLKASGGDTYLWSNGEKTQSIVVSPDKTKTYSVTVSKDGCEDVDKVTVKVESASTPVVAGISDDLTICKGDEILLKASGGTEYVWSNGKTTSEIKVSPDKTTTYEVTVTDGLTSDQAEVTVTVNEAVANIGGDVSIIKGEEITLSTTEGDTYLWSTGETTQSIKVSPDISKFYSVTVSAGSCKSIDKIKVTVISEGISVVAGVTDDQSICKGEEVILTATGGSEYNWSNGETGSEIKVSPDKTTTYEVIVSDGQTSDQAEVTVTVNEVNADAGKDITINSGQQVTLTAIGGESYEWSNGATSASIIVSPDITTVYTVIVSENGCVATDKVKVSVVDSVVEPVIAEISEDLTICKGDEILLKASGGTEYVWSNGMTTAEIKVSPDKATTYKVTVSDGITKDEAEVTVSVNEVKANAGKDASIKKGESIKLTADGGEYYQWSNGQTSKSIIVSPLVSTDYQVQVERNGCIDFDTVRVEVSTLENSHIAASAGKDVTICVGENVTLTASGGAAYKWNNGETTKSISVNPIVTTTYSVEVFDGAKSGADEVTVVVDHLEADAGNNVTITEGESVTLSAQGGDLYEWSNGQNTQSITISPKETKIYTVTVFKNGCQDHDSVQVTVNKRPDLNELPPIAQAGEDVNICLGESVTLQAKGQGSFLWSTGDESTVIKVSPKRTTTYILNASNGDVTVEDKVVVYVDNCGNDPVATTDLNLTVYPNPSNGLITMNISGVETTLSLELFDLNGRLVHKDKVDGRYQQVNKQVDLSALPKGMYIVRIFNQNQSIVSKILLV